MVAVSVLTRCEVIDRQTPCMQAVNSSREFGNDKGANPVKIYMFVNHKCFIDHGNKHKCIYFKMYSGRLTDI